ncbi:MAG TPA: long-chain-acyl-CoA synthetase [Stellaceae bacterium]|nr:long-chain-acyl-CoA synthetase [Stellaceae bacterium]
MAINPNPDGISSADAWRRALEMTAPIADHPSVTLPTLIEDLADRFGAAPALSSEQEGLSYRDLADRVARYARWALAQRLAGGEVVCLVMANCPDYMAIWLGITRVGGIVALVNTNLVGASLEDAIKLAAPRHVIVGAGLVGAVAAVLPRLDPEIRCWVHGTDGFGLPRIDHPIAADGRGRLDPADCRAPSIYDRALYLYTSGTTGLPKAAFVSHFRLMQWSHWFAGMMAARPTDRMYDCLPMYHSTGGVVATGAMLVAGGCVVIRQRFSASRFWADIVEEGCTLFQYIGELCRYLVNAPPDPRETRHRLRLCCGNGMQGDVWSIVQRRFRIPQVLEFYAATEGSFSLYNCEGKVGAVGRIPPYLAHRFPVALVRLDAETGAPLRDDKGLCIRCAVDEPGEAIGKIADDRASPSGRFEGYTDAEASERKILRDVFARGDAWYRSGDLMRRDRSGYFYFVDRIGDTFRWKGENVSTMEVAEAIAACPGIVDAVVCGVAVPGTEGRAGLAAIVTGKNFDLAGFRARLAERLPDYAQPVFLRICGKIEMTATFKPQKQNLAREGYDPAVIADPLYFNDRSLGAFMRLDAALHRAIRDGKVRL